MELDGIGTVEDGPPWTDAKAGASSFLLCPELLHWGTIGDSHDAVWYRIGQCWHFLGCKTLLVEAGSNRPLLTYVLMRDFWMIVV